jgi:hypothetical protein
MQKIPGNANKYADMHENHSLSYENSRHLSPSDLEVGVSRVSPSRDA